MKTERRKGGAQAMHNVKCERKVAFMKLASELAQLTKICASFADVLRCLQFTAYKHTHIVFPAICCANFTPHFHPGAFEAQKS